MFGQKILGVKVDYHSYLCVRKKLLIEFCNHLIPAPTFSIFAHHISVSFFLLRSRDTFKISYPDLRQIAGLPSAGAIFLLPRDHLNPEKQRDFPEPSKRRRITYAEFKGYGVYDQIGEGTEYQAEPDEQPAQ